MALRARRLDSRGPGSSRSGSRSLFMIARGLLAPSLLALLLAEPAFADGVALAVTLPEANPIHRDFAAGVVADAQERWTLLRPQLIPDEVDRCQAEEPCLLQLAQARGATHLLLIGVAGLGSAEFVVSIKLLDATSGEELASHSDLATPGRDPRGAGRRVAHKTFASAPGIPRRNDSPLPPTRPARAPSGQGGSTPASAEGETSSRSEPLPALSPLAWTGWGLTGGGAALTVGAFAIGGAASVSPGLLGGRSGLETFVALSAPLLAGMMAAGLCVVAVDAWLPRLGDEPKTQAAQPSGVGP